MGLLDGKVVLVTGSGNGIGRAHALAMAREGARIIVNDLGGSRDGTGASDSAAQKVVDEIKALGGDAVANHDSVTDVEGCQRMVAAGVEKWGRLDVIVNNAGILRDKTFAKMTDAEWDLVVAVHLTGARNVTRAAFDALVKQGGAIINTTSYSGMIGNFGQSNYAAAKAGIYGFTRVMSMELRKFGVTANCVAPVAKTRMTEDIAMVENEWTPEQISPIVVFLASELGKSVTGQVFGVQGQRIHLYEVKTNDGVEKPGKDLWTPQEISAKIGEIMAWEAPAAAKAGGEDLVTSVFSHFPAGFKAGAAPGWRANIQWVVKGGTDQTVKIDDAGCQTSPGLVGAPTCTVKTDKDTLLALFKGELEPQKAFMSGKAAADNMADLMKLASAFDFKKVAAAFQAAGAGGGAAAGPAKAAEPPRDVVTAVFGHIPAGFNNGKVPGWKATFHWNVKGANDQTITVDGDTCTVATGLVGTPTCTVKIDRDTLIAMFQGQMDPAKAFMSGKASADNMGDLMKMGMAFDFKKVAAAYEASNSGTPAAAAALAPAPAAPAEKKSTIGKRYDGGMYFVDRAEFQAYAKATDDENPAYFGADAIAPPMYHTRAFISLMMKLATDPELELDLLRLVHAEHAVEFRKPLKHGDILQLRGTMKSLEEKSSGRLATFGIVGFVDGEVAVEGTTAYFIRGKKKDEGDKKPAAPVEPPPAPERTITEVVTKDQATRYAGASGDSNPIHVDENVAKSAGLPGVILHGLCTMAFAQRDLVNELAGGDPRKLASLGVRFAKPVFPGQNLALKVWRDGGSVKFATEDASGATVISNGTATIR